MKLDVLHGPKTAGSTSGNFHNQNSFVQKPPPSPIGLTIGSTSSSNDIRTLPLAARTASSSPVHSTLSSSSEVSKLPIKARCVRLKSDKGVKKAWTSFEYRRVPFRISTLTRPWKERGRYTKTRPFEELVEMSSGSRVFSDSDATTSCYSIC